MKISEVIEKMKKYHKGITQDGTPIDEATTRDKILYGNPDQECSGIVTTCWASADVIEKAHQLGANLIICHEALFWNRGDHTDWLLEEKNKTFMKKKALLDQYNLVVWRDHDYIHSGIPYQGKWVDGIFTGVMKELGWEDYLICDPSKPMLFEFPEATTAEAIARLWIDRFGLNGMKLVGKKDTPVKKVWICGHIMGGNNDSISKIDQENIDLAIALELIDYTTSEYIRDSGMLGYPKAILAMGHFNNEEPGMKYMVNYIPEALNEDIPCHYVQSGDMYEFII